MLPAPAAILMQSTSLLAEHAHQSVRKHDLLVHSLPLTCIVLIEYCSRQHAAWAAILQQWHSQAVRLHNSAALNGAQM